MPARSHRPSMSREKLKRVFISSHSPAMMNGVRKIMETQKEILSACSGDVFLRSIARRSCPPSSGSTGIRLTVPMHMFAEANAVAKVPEEKQSKGSVINVSRRFAAAPATHIGIHPRRFPLMLAVMHRPHTPIRTCSTRQPRKASIAARCPDSCTAAASAPHAVMLSGSSRKKAVSSAKK